MKKIFMSTERIEECQWNFQENVTYDNIKVTKKQGSALGLILLTILTVFTCLTFYVHLNK